MDNQCTKMNTIDFLLKIQFTDLQQITISFIFWYSFNINTDKKK